MPSASIIRIDSIDDPRISPYGRMKERDLAREGDRFIVESATVVKRFLASPFRAESLLVADHRLDEMASLVGPDVPIYAASGSIINQVIGFKFHSGVLACGVRPASVGIEQLAGGWEKGPITLVILPEIANTDNLGSLIRVSAAFGATAMVLGEQCCDPFYRQSIRVSMGTVFHLPIVRSQRILEDLHLLREKLGVELMAAVVEESAEPLDLAGRGARLGILFGNEAQGLSAEQIAACARRVTIPMKLGTDSLNVSVAAGVFLHHFGGRV